MGNSPSITLTEDDLRPGDKETGATSTLEQFVEDGLSQLIVGRVPASRALQAPASEHVSEEMLESAALSANVLTRIHAERYKAIILDRPSPTSFKVGLVNDWNMDERRAVAKALVTTTQLINFVSITEGQFAQLLAHAYGNQSTKDANAVADARETKDWSILGNTTRTHATASDVETGTARFSAGGRSAAALRLANVIDISDDEEMLRLSRQPLDALEIKDFNRVTLWYFVRSKASDCSFEGGRRIGGRIRYTIDDVPQAKFQNIPLEVMVRICNSIAQMAGQDYSEMKRRRLDSTITLLVSRPGGGIEEVELRFATMPTTPIPEITLRSMSDVITDINKIGLLKPQHAQVLSALSMTQGVFLITGPTGSGKTNSLAAYLAEIEKLDNRKIIEMADPIEVYSDYRSQMQITQYNTWDDGYSAMLRNAPKICVVGELRSKQVTTLALELATTGHLVFATYHTSDVETTFSRLLKMGIPPEQLTDSVVGIQSQRLARTLCRCKVIDDVESAAYGHTLYKPKGCPLCLGIGYKGRTSLPEILLFNSEIQDWLASGMSGKEIVSRASHQKWMLPMEDVATAKVLAGMTTFKEVERVAKFAEAKSREQERYYYAASAQARAAREAGPSTNERSPESYDENVVDAEWEEVPGSGTSAGVD